MGREQLPERPQDGSGGCPGLCCAAGIPQWDQPQSQRCCLRSDPEPSDPWGAGAARSHLAVCAQPEILARGSSSRRGRSEALARVSDAGTECCQLGKSVRHSHLAAGASFHSAASEKAALEKWSSVTLLTALRACCAPARPHLRPAGFVTSARFPSASPGGHSGLGTPGSSGRQRWETHAAPGVARGAPGAIPPPLEGIYHLPRTPGTLCPRPQPRGCGSTRGSDGFFFQKLRSDWGARVRLTWMAAAVKSRKGHS